MLVSPLFSLVREEKGEGTNTFASLPFFSDKGEKGERNQYRYWFPLSFSDNDGFYSVFISYKGELIFFETRGEQGMNMVKELNSILYIYFFSIKLKHMVVICHFYLHDTCYLQKMINTNMIFLYSKQ